MKPLNRPMFRYGGPIKEGIMQGMKDGGLSKQFNTGLVGDERYPKTGGRENHAFFLAPLAFNVARTALMPFGRLAIQRALRSGLIKGPGGTVRGGLAPSRTFNPNTDMVNKLKFTPNRVGSYFMASPEYKFVTGAGGRASKFVKGAAKGLARSPLGLGVTAATLTDILPGGRPFGPDKFLPNILGQRFDPVTGNKIPGTGLFNPGGDKDKTDDGTKPFRRKEGKDGTTTGGGTENKVEKLDPKQFEERKKYYYSLMGIDKMQKGAAYDSLIDASNIIQEEGGDLKGAIKSGTLQNRIIQAISKNLDKSTDLKKQIDAAILKGEITKDIEQSKVPESIRTARALGISDKEYKDKILGKDSVATTLSNYMMKQGALTPDVVAGALKTEGKDPLAVIATDKVEDFKKKFGADKDEIDLLLSAEDLQEGFYVVGKRIIQIDDKGDASFYY